MGPEYAQEIVRDAYEDRRDKLGYDEIRHVEAVVEGTTRALSGHSALVLSDAQVVAWLHDAIEDGLFSFRQLYKDLNRRQFEALLMITRDNKQTYMDYIRMIRDYPGLVGKILRAVKSADLDHNITRPCPEHMQGMREPGGRYDRARKLLATA